MSLLRGEAFEGAFTVPKYREESMIAIGFLLILIGAGMAWTGPIDPEYSIDWIVFVLGLILIALGVQLVMPLFVTAPSTTTA